jgi:transcriptional regulator with XRE-family HTH domain
MMAGHFMHPGENLKELRSRLGVTLRQVEEESQKIAKARANPEFFVSNHWLTKLENTDSVPSIFKLFSLSAIYRVKFSELLSLFGVDLDLLPKYQLESPTQQTHLMEMEVSDAARKVIFPVRFDRGFRVEATNLLSRIVEVWGEVPISLIQHLDIKHGRYGYIGLQDYTMYPLLRPGSFVQIDPSSRKVQSRPWRTELDRPIYFVELRDSYACCWCELQGNELILIPHSLSPCTTRRLPVDRAEVVGQVTAVAMRIVDPVDRPSDLVPQLTKRS